MRKRTGRLMRATLGGFPWWKSLSMVSVGVVFAYGMGLRHGTPATAWATAAVTLAFAADLLWWTHVRTRGPA